MILNVFIARKNPGIVTSSGLSAQTTEQNPRHSPFHLHPYLFTSTEAD